MIEIKNIKCKLNEGKESILKKIQEKLKTKENLEYQIIKEAIDARKAGNIFFVYRVLVNYDYNKLSKDLKEDLDIEKYEKIIDDLTQGDEILDYSPVIVGSGPSGLMATYFLALAGLKPILLERGKGVEERSIDVETFWKEGILNPESNVQFGEGGAGTFSDGKLTSRSKDKRINKILSTFHKFGADEEILYKQKPHIGTDVLRHVVKNIRDEIIKNGGRVEFETKMIDFELENGSIKKVITNKGEIETRHLILAIGHSARDTFKLLVKKDVKIENKAFAVGFRIEHKQEDINKAQYKVDYNHPRLGSAEYQLTFNSKTHQKGIYTFCMCPGGRVIASSSDENTLVVNGMSYNSRNLVNANSAIIATISEEDYGTEPLAGMYFQEKIEKEAFKLGGSNYFAPVQRVEDFIKGVPSKKIGKLIPSYKPNYTLTDLSKLYPENISLAIKEGILAMNNKLKVFSNGDAILTGVETRSSSPIRILRDRDSMESLSTSGLYPIGEGAGYAGGIMSSAVDGYKIAELLISKYKEVK